MLRPGVLCWFGDEEGLLIGVECRSPRLPQESLMPSCLPSVAGAIRAGVPADEGTPSRTVVRRASGVRVRGGTATAGGDAAPAAGELAVFCRPVVTAPAAVRRDGTVLADAWLPDLVRLGELERHLGDGVIQAAVDAEIAKGRLKPRQRRRIMSYPLVIRLMIAMTLSPDGPYGEALARLAGLLAGIPFTREWHIPTSKVITDWRLPVPASVMEGIFWQASGPLIEIGRAHLRTPVHLEIPLPSSALKKKNTTPPVGS